MNPQEKKDNKNYADHFTRIPNMLFKAFPNLTKEEKWLYACLRFICWDGTKYVALRHLSEETGYSVGALSKMLPRLDKAGLIHTEIKKKQRKDGTEIGNPLYHITISDVWEKNRKFFSCSSDEQETGKPVLFHEQACSRNDTSLSHLVNEPVHEKEQVYVQKEGQDSIDKTKEKTSFKRDGKEKGFSFSEVSFPEEDNATFPEEKPTSKPLTATETAILDWWDTTQAIPTNRAAKGIKKPLESIAAIVDQGYASIETLEKARTHMLTRKNSFCRDNPLNLFLFNSQLQGALTEMKTTISPEENGRIIRAPATFRGGRPAEEEAAKIRALSSMPPPPKSHEELRREAY